MPATDHANAANARRDGGLRITVLAGGPSAEREISLASGEAIAAGLRRRGHEVFLADIGPDDLSALDHPADVVFPALHGTFGEDGTLQRIMEERGLCFVGSGSRASSTAMDKVATKRVADGLGIPTPEYEVVEPGGQAALSVPVIVKPVSQGSSVATTIVHAQAELTPTARRVAEQFGRALVERFIEGAEITVGVLGGRTLPAIRIRPGKEFYDFEAKYEDAHTEYLLDTGVSQVVLDMVAQQSLKLFRTLGCRHLGRVDWMVGSDGAPWFLEVNTLPGFTSHSLVPKAAAAVGLDFDTLVETIVRMALEDHG